MSRFFNSYQYRERIASAWRQWSIQDRGSFLITIPLVSLVGFTTLLFWLKGTTQEAARWVEHTQIVILKSDRVLIDLLSAEAAVRGYGIVQSDDFLNQYRAALKALPSELEQLKQLVQDNPKQSERLRQIQQSTEQKLKELNANLQSANTLVGPTYANVQLASMWRVNEAAITVLKTQLRAFQSEEQRLLDVRTKRLSRQQDWSTIAIWLCIGIGSLSSLIALYVFRNLGLDLQLRKDELLGHQDRISAIANNIVDGVITLDKASCIKSINPAAAEMFGLERDAILGQAIKQLLPEFMIDDTVSSIDSLTETLGTDQRRRIQTMGLRSDGNFFPLDLSISKLQEDDEWLVLIQDITERQQSEAKLRARADELTQLANVLAQTNTDLNAKNRELNQFAYVASHDLKAPLRAISNLSAWIEEDIGDQLSEENQEQFRLLRGRVQRMESLISGLLEYSRVGGTEEQPQLISTTALLHKVIDSMSIPASFEISIDPNMPTLVTRRLRLFQIFSNLISNAIKHHDRQEGKVSITVQDLDQFYRFSVTDDGPGIAPQYHQKVFTIFQTLQARDKVENTGIGLSIVKKAVETEGGTVEIQSAASQGSTFRFTWPKEPDFSQRERHKPTEPQSN